MLSFVIVVCYLSFVKLNQKCSNVNILVMENPLVTKVTADDMTLLSVFLVTKKKNFHSNTKQKTVTPFFKNNLRFLEFWFSYQRDHKVIFFKITWLYL